MTLLEELTTWAGNMKSKTESTTQPPRPMLAESLLGEKGEEEKLKLLRFPCYASFKIDGYRCLMGEKAWTRSGKEHQAPVVQRLARVLGELKLGTLDGELIVKDEGFAKGGGKLRQKTYQGSLEYIVYDIVVDGVNFRTRLELLNAAQQAIEQRKEELATIGNWEEDPEKNEELRLLCSVKFLKHWWVEDMGNLLELEKYALELGYEGLCMRAPYGMYKHGRGTIKEQVLLKLKRWGQNEARVMEVISRKMNMNPAEEGAWGLVERSSKQDGLVDTDCLGAFSVVGINGPWKGVEFSIGTFLGLDEEEKREIWKNQGDYLGRVLTFKYLPIGSEDKPRHPVFLGWRPDWDMGDGEGEGNGGEGNENK